MKMKICKYDMKMKVVCKVSIFVLAFFKQTEFESF